MWKSLITSWQLENVDAHFFSFLNCCDHLSNLFFVPFFIHHASPNVILSYSAAHSTFPGSALCCCYFPRATFSFFAKIKSNDTGRWTSTWNPSASTLSGANASVTLFSWSNCTPVKTQDETKKSRDQEQYLPSCGRKEWVWYHVACMYVYVCVLWILRCGTMLFLAGVHVRCESARRIFFTWRCIVCWIGFIR